MPEKWGSITEKCTGVEMREPQHWSDKNRMIWTYELNPSMHNMDELCEQEQLAREIDPIFLYGENDLGR